MRDILKETELRRLYVVEKMTDVEIASLFGCTKGTVYRTRKRFSIPALKRWERNCCNPTEHQLQIIYGSLLGDASVSNGKKGKYRCESVFEVKHCVKQKDYVFWKYEKLKNLCRSEPKEINEQWRLRTFHHPFFSNLRKVWYPRGIKRIPDFIYDELGPLGLSVWYMDDGTLSSKSSFLKISTCSFSEKEHCKLISWLKERWKINSHMVNYSGYRNLVIDLDSRKKFIKMVKLYVVPCLEYKSRIQGGK